MLTATQYQQWCLRLQHSFQAQEQPQCPLDTTFALIAHSSRLLALEERVVRSLEK